MEELIDMLRTIHFDLKGISESLGDIAGCVEDYTDLDGQYLKRFRIDTRNASLDNISDSLEELAGCVYVFIGTDDHVFRITGDVYTE